MENSIEDWKPDPYVDDDFEATFMGLAIIFWEIGKCLVQPLLQFSRWFLGMKPLSEA